jgi:hypothetical protein
MEGNESTDQDTATNQETGETNLIIIYPVRENDTVITRTNNLPKFAYSVSLLLVALGGVIVLVRMLLIQQEKLA